VSCVCNRHIEIPQRRIDFLKAEKKRRGNVDRVQQSRAQNDPPSGPQRTVGRIVGARSGSRAKGERTGSDESASFRSTDAFTPHYGERESAVALRQTSYLRLVPVERLGALAQGP
jgi:hypothetical protein